MKSKKKRRNIKQNILPKGDIQSNSEQQRKEATNQIVYKRQKEIVLQTKQRHTIESTHKTRLLSRN